MTHRSRFDASRSLVGLLTSLACLTACTGSGGWTPVWGPGPSAAIRTSVIDHPTYEAAPTRRCDGPSDEIRALGSLCTATLPDVLLVADAGDVGFVVYGGPGSRNAIIVFGYFAADASVLDHTADVRYAARYVPDVGAAGGGSVYAQVLRDVALWESGDELTGSIATRTQLGDAACSGGIFRGVATLQWRSTTITFRFDAAWPC